MATPNERPRNWVQDHMARYLETDGEDGHIWPAYDEYQTRTTREIPVVLLERKA